MPVCQFKKCLMNIFKKHNIVALNHYIYFPIKAIVIIIFNVLFCIQVQFLKLNTFHKNQKYHMLETAKDILEIN